MCSLVRVNIFCPITEAGSVATINGIITKLGEDFGGVTYSRLPESLTELTPFEGIWLDVGKRIRTLYRERIIVIQVDVDLGDNRVTMDFQDEDCTISRKEELLSYLETLKAYGEAHLGQDLLWITYYDVKRIT